MAKPAKVDHGRSVLWVAFEAYQRGDVVTARALANEVLAGKRGPNDASVAKELSAELSSKEAPVADTVEAVAKELVQRTTVPPKSFLMVAAVAAAYLLLMILAIVRY